MKQILTKLSLRNRPQEIPVGCGNQSSRNLFFFNCSEGTKTAVFDRPKNLALQRVRQVSNLIKKERSPVGLYKQTLLVRGTGVRSATNTIERGFKKRLGDGTQIARDKRCGFEAELMNRLCNELFSGTRFPDKQDRGSAARRADTGDPQFAHHATRSRQGLKCPPSAIHPDGSALVRYILTLRG